MIEIVDELRRILAVRMILWAGHVVPKKRREDHNFLMRCASACDAMGKSAS